MNEPQCYRENCFNPPERVRTATTLMWICDEHREKEWFYCIHRDPKRCHWHPNIDGFSYDGRAVCFEEYQRLVRLGSRYFTAHETAADKKVDNILVAIARGWNWIENFRTKLGRKG